MTKTFHELGMSAEILKALNEIKFHTPFPIQEKAIPLISKGIDVIGQAHTGTGKTGAFSLPMISKIKPAGSIQALILVPTRELAVQITAEINKFLRYTSIRCVSIYGGQSIGLQHDLLKRGAQIVVATPGRLIDHLKRGSIQLDDIRFVVLDEADRMLDMGFIEDIKFILFYVREDRQTCLFSATMPQEILRLAHDYMKEPEEIRLNEDELSLDTIDQSYLVVNEREKFRHLCYFIKNRDEKQTIVFAATKQRTQKLAHDLKQEGFRAITIHGDLSQKQRDIAMYNFRNGKEDILVATDIAARGIDVPAVGHVINFDIPEDPLVYFHRIGRTARAGATGKAISLVSQDRIDNFGRILSQTEQVVHKLNEEMGIDVPVPQQRYARYSRNGFSGGYQRRIDRPYNRSYGYNRNNYRNSIGSENSHIGNYGARRSRFGSYSQRQNYR